MAKKDKLFFNVDLEDVKFSLGLDEGKEWYSLKDAKQYLNLFKFEKEVNELKEGVDEGDTVEADERDINKISLKCFKDRWTLRNHLGYVKNNRLYLYLRDSEDTQFTMSLGIILDGECVPHVNTEEDADSPFYLDNEISLTASEGVKSEDALKDFLKDNEYFFYKDVVDYLEEKGYKVDTIDTMRAHGDFCFYSNDDGQTFLNCEFKSKDGNSSLYLDFKVAQSKVFFKN